MQVIYKKLVVIRPKTIKQKQTLRCQVWCLLNSYAHCLTLCHISFTANTQITNFFNSDTSTSNSIIFHFFGLCFHFFCSWVNGNTSFWARPLKIAQAFFSCPWTTFFDAFLKKRIATPKGVLNAGLKLICNWVVRN